MKKVLSVIMVIAMIFSVMPLHDVYAESQTGVSREEEVSGEEQSSTKEVSEDGEGTDSETKESTAEEMTSEEGENAEHGKEEETASGDVESAEPDTEQETASGAEEGIEHDSGEEADSEDEESMEHDSEEETVLAAALKAIEDGTASRLTAAEWIAESSSNPGDLIWTTASSDMSGKLSVIQTDVTSQAFDKAVKIATTQKATNNWDAQVFFKLDGEIKENDKIFFAFRIKGLSNATDSDNTVKTNIRIRPENSLTAAEKNINVNTVLGNPSFAVSDDWVLYCGTADSPVGNSGSFGSIVFQVGMAAEEFEIADLCVINMSRGTGESGEEPDDSDDGEAQLAKAAAQYKEGKASLLTAEEWNAVGGIGDNCWVDCNTSMVAADVKVSAETDAEYGKALRIETLKKATGNYHAQVFFKTVGKVKTGDRLFYAFRMKGIKNDTDTSTPGEVVTNMRIRPSNGGDGSVNFQRNDVRDTIDEEWTLVWGYADAPANSADSGSVDGSGNKYGAFVLQIGMAQEEFLISDFRIYNLSRTPDEVDEPEEEVERFTFEEIMEQYKAGKGTLVTYEDLADENAYELEIQEPLEDNNVDFVVKQVAVANQSFDKALNVRTTKTGDQAWDAQIYFNLDHTKEIKKGDTLLFGCKVRGISSVTNKEAMFVTANTRIRPDRSSSSNFDITSSINADDENDWTQIYGGCTAAAASKADADGAWVFQLGSAVQELEIADVFVINFGNEFSEKQMPIMTKTYLGMEEDAQWRKDALERIEKIRRQDVSIRLTDTDGNPVEQAVVKVDQTRHEFGFGTIVNVDDYNKWDTAKQQKYKEAFEKIAHNRAGFENALKHYYITNPERQALVDDWMDYFIERGIDIRGHVLIYGSDDRLRTVDMDGVSTDMPNKELLASDTEEGRAALRKWTKNHISTYVNKYQDKIYNWDVVNENMTSHDWADRLGGYDAIVQWFEDAHEADPDAKLTYNDFGILSRDKGHQDYHYDLCKYLVDHDAPMTTIGIQGHVSLISPIEIINILDRFSGLGKEIEITEFTYEDDDPEFQAQFTRDFMIAVFSEEAVTSITTWGFYQGCMYQPKAAMVDNNFNLKPNGEVWQDMIYNEWWTNENGMTETDGTYHTRGYKGTYDVTVQVGDVEQKFELALSDEKAVLNLVYDGSIIAKASDTHDHIYGESWSMDSESHWKECSECGERAEQENHSFGEWNVEIEPSATQEGSMYCECSVCGYRKTESIEPHVHSYGDEWKMDSESHWKECSECGERAELAEHSFGEWIVEADPGITQAGSRYCECSVCGYRKTESIEPHVHNYGNEWNMDSESHWKECSECGERVEQENHSFGEWIVEIEPSATQEGSMYCECSVCGYRKTENIAKVVPQGLWIAGIEESGYQYTGKAIKPQILVFDHDKLLQEKTDYTISYKNNIKANDGTAKQTAPTIIVTGKGNYSGKETAVFKILPVALNSSSITVENVTLEYNNKLQNPVPAVTYNGKKLTNNKDFTVSYPASESGAYHEPGNYDILLTAVGNGNFTGTRTVTFTITKDLLISKASIGKIPGTEYTGNPIEPKPVVKMKGKTLTEGTDYELHYTDNTEIGTAAVVVTGINDYAGTKRVSFKITGKSLSKAVVAGQTNGIYNGEEQFRNLTVTLDATPLTEDKDYEVSYTNNQNAGTATITIKGIHAFTGTVKKTFKIAPYDFGNDVDHMLGGLPEDLHTKYVKGGSKPEISLTFNGVKLTAGKDYSVIYKNNKAVTTDGTRNLPVMVIKGKGNFKGTVQKTFTIEKKALNDAQFPVIIKAADVAFTDKPGKYISKPVLTDTDGTKLTAGKDYEKTVIYTLEDGTELDKQSKPAIGTNIKVKVKGMGDYSGNLETVYRITALDFNKAKITIAAKPYTGAPVTLEKDDIVVKVSGKLLTYGVDYEISEDSYKNNTSKGTAKVMIAGKGNYGGTQTKSFKIAPRRLVWLWNMF